MVVVTRSVIVDLGIKFTVFNQLSEPREIQVELCLKGIFLMIVFLPQVTLWSAGQAASVSVGHVPLRASACSGPYSPEGVAVLSTQNSRSCCFW